ncbi:hypothetical protein JCM11641_001572 [Rhodosporidiobolus odoratus]
MLSSALRPPTQVACSACAQRALRTAIHTIPSASRPLHTGRRTPAPSTSSISSALQGRRGQATFAQVGDQIDEHPNQDGQEEGRDPRSDEIAPAEEASDKDVETSLEGLREREAAAELEGAVADVGEKAQPGADRAEAPPAETPDTAESAIEQLFGAMQAEAAPSAIPGLPTDSSPSATSESSSSPSAESLILSPQITSPLSSPLFSSDPSRPKRGASLDPHGPQLSDLLALRPKRFRIPTADCPDSLRLIYTKEWERAVARLNRAFTKQQLFVFAGPKGLDLDLTEPRLRTGTPGKKHKWWKSKRFDQMSKNELVQAILVIEFGMVHPAMVPAGGKHAPQTSEVVTLSNRTLFLLLSPNSPTISTITRQLGVNVQFRREPKSGLVNLLLKGRKDSVSSAVTEIQMVDELQTCASERFTLPCPATTLRPEVYQSISRSAKVFFSPVADSPTSLDAAAVSSDSFKRVEGLLHAAFSDNSLRTNTALYASLPSNLESLPYSMMPLTPTVPPPSLSSSGATCFARVKSVSLAPPTPVEALPAELEPDSPSPEYESEYPDARPGNGDLVHAAQVELRSWTKRMRFERTSRVEVYAPPTFRIGKEPSLLAMLRAPFAEDEKRGQMVQVKARFGHVAWPLYKQTEHAGLGPALTGQWSWDNFREWVGRKKGEVKSVFLASPPAGLTQSTGVFSPLPLSSPLSNIFSTLPPSSSVFELDSDAPFALTAVQRADLETYPALYSRTFRRWVYRPVLGAGDVGEEEVAAGGRELDRVEIDIGSWGKKGGSEEAERMVKRVKENLVRVMVPTAATDAEYSMSTTSLISEADWPPELFREADEGSIHDPVFRASPPPRITLSSVPYMLVTDRSIRRTTISPPLTSPNQTTQVLEKWIALTRDGHWKLDSAERGTDAWIRVTKEGGETVQGLRDRGGWREALEVVEERCNGNVGGARTGETMQVDQRGTSPPSAQPPTPASPPVALSPGPLKTIREEESSEPSKQPSHSTLQQSTSLQAALSALSGPRPSPDSTQKRMDDYAEANAAAAALVTASAAAQSSVASSAAHAGSHADGERPTGSFDPAAPNAVNGLPNPLPANYDKTQPICANCATQTTPLWRRSHDSTHILCNACALFFKMKGRPRPISLKTDVIKSRNRSKGKSTSKDRGAKSAAVPSSANAPPPPARGVSKERSESMTRNEGGRKSVPGGAGAGEDTEMKEGRTKPFGDGTIENGDSRKARKVMPTAPVSPYGLPYPGFPYPYPYPHAPHPHGHQPYPPPRSRSRSSDPTRRAQSVDARQRGVSAAASPDGTPTPPSGAPHMPAFPFGFPGLVPGAPPPEGYPGYPPFYPYGPPPAGFTPGQPPAYPYPSPPFNHPAAALAHAAQAAAALHAPSAITHAQSDSRSHSPATETASRPASTRGSASPPQTSAAPPAANPAPVPPQSWYPHPNPNYHLHQPHTHSPLAGVRPPVGRTISGSPANVPKPSIEESANASNAGGRLTLPPMTGGAAVGPSGSSSEAATSRAASEEKHLHLRSFSSVQGGPSPYPLTAATTISRQTNLFDSRLNADSNAQAGPSTGVRERGASISSASPSASGSSEGVRSPDTASRALAPSWGSLSTGGASGTPSDERRGRSEKRFDDYGIAPGGAAGGSAKGKARDSYDEESHDRDDEIDELEEEGEGEESSVASVGAAGSNGSSHSRVRMNGVETGINELRVSGQSLPHYHHSGPGRAAASPVGGTAPGGSGRQYGGGGSSRSRSRARGEAERGRSRGVLGSAPPRSGSVNSASRGRGSSSASSAGASRGTGGGRHDAPAPSSSSTSRDVWPPEAMAEIARLKTKISELTFLNGLMQSRLGQLEGPGRVPRNVMTSLTAETPRPDMDEYAYGRGEEDEEMGRPEPIEEEVPAGFE